VFQLKENNEENPLQQKLVALEEQLIKTKEQLQQESAYNKQLEAILTEEQQVKKSKIITIKSATKIEFVNVDDIICCNADEAYTHIELINYKTITAAKTLSTFETILEGHTFFRISKSHLINTNHIVTFFKDRNQILLKGDFLLDVARRRRVEFLKNI
jgi:two-component system, LytTR family, response regulator